MRPRYINAKFGFNTDVVRVDVAEVQRGQPVLINYKWTNTRWDEIESRIVGLCAWEARAGEQGLGPEGGAYVEQLVVALRRGGIGAMMLRAVRRSCGATDGRVELQVHDKNEEARQYYERLGMRACRWQDESGVPRAIGDSLFEPTLGCRIMQVGGAELDAELAGRRGRHGEPDGIELEEYNGLAELKAAGLLKGARAMANRVYGSAVWYVEWDGAGIDALYKPRRETRFVVARRQSGAPPWRSHSGAGDNDDDAADGGEDEAGGEEEGEARGEQGGGGGGGATGGGATDEEESDEEHEIRRAQAEARAARDGQRSRKRQREGTAGEAEGFEAGIGASDGGKEQEAQEGGHGQKRGRSEEQETRSERVTKAMRQAGAAASGMARAAARTVWTMMGGRHVEETAEKSGPPRAGDHGEPGEAATGDG